MSIPLLPVPVRRWECPHCSFRDTTREVEPHTRFHPCSGLGITAPMVQEGSQAHTVVKAREDYVGSENVQLTASGVPIMSITTEHPDGHTDLAVYAPTATARIGL